MATIKVPSNKIQFKYTSGGEYIVEKTYQSYQGHYYELNGKAFAGNEYNQNAPVLIKADSNKVNSLLLNPKTATYGVVSGTKLYPTNIPSYVYVPTKEDIDRGYVVRYFAKKNNTSPNILIKEINETTFNENKDNPNYQLISITFDFPPGSFSKGIPRNIDQVEKKMPGIKDWLSSTTPTPLQQLAAQPTPTKPVRKTTKIDGKVGQITSKFRFPTAFLTFVNTGDVTNLGLEGNPSLQRFVKEHRLSTEQMYAWNDFVDWMKDKGYKGSPNMDQASFRLDVLREYVKLKPNFFINPAAAYDDGVIDKVKDVQRMLQVYRLYVIKQASLQLYLEGRAIPGEGQAGVTITDPATGREKTLNLLSPSSPDWKLTPLFMEWAIVDPEEETPVQDGFAKQ
jgi:hypothetical protein